MLDQKQHEGVTLRARPVFGLVDEVSVEQKFKLLDLYARYTWAYDCSDEDGFVDNFTPNAVVIGHDDEHVGHDAIRLWFRYLLGLRRFDRTLWQHLSYQQRFHGDDRTCHVFGYATHFYAEPDNRQLGVRSAGYYVDKCVNVDGVWLFQQHSVNSWNESCVPWKQPRWAID